MEGEQVAECVAAPKQKLQACLNNKKAYTRRAVLLQTGKEVQEAKDLEHTKTLGRLAAGVGKRGRKEHSIASEEPEAKLKRAD